MRTQFAFAVFLLAIGAAAPARAQSDDSAKLRDQLRYVTLQFHQAQDDKATILAQKNAVELERDALKKQLSAAQAELARARHDGERVNAVAGDLARAKGALTQAADAARQNQAERDKLQTVASNTHTVLEACEAKNTQLLAVSRDILKAYEDFNFIDSLSAREPFIRMKRVELENIAQDYRDRIDNGIFDPKAVHAPALVEPKQPGSAATKPAVDRE
jgi:chromosome segregation ATPase